MSPLLAGEEDAVPVGMLVDTRYEIRGRIGRGGMGEIYLCTDTRLRRSVALKVLAPELSTPEWRARLQAEAETMAQIEHSGIVPLHDLGLFPDGRLYYVMKYIDGRTLHEEMASAPNRPRLLAFLAQAAEILHVAHERGVIHRDIKPPNIMVDGHGQVYVMDWGLSRVVDEAIRSRSLPGQAGLTVVGTVLGTIEYMPPEQARGDLPAMDRRSDIYSLGAILYVILTGVPPITGETVTDRLRAAEEAAVLPPRQRDASLHRDVEAICLKAMAKRKEDRYETAIEFARDLRRYLEGEPTVARPRPPMAIGWRRIRRHKRLASFVSLLVVLALGLGAWVTWRGTRTYSRVRDHLEAAAQAEEKGELTKALASFRTAHELDEMNPEAKEGVRRVTGKIDEEIARLLAEAERAEAGGDYVRARTDLRAALSLRENIPSVREALARIRKKEEEEARGQRALQAGFPAVERALRAPYDRPTDAASIRRLAAQAEESLRKVVLLAPRLAMGHYLIGRLREIQGRNAEAESSWRWAATLDPAFGPARFHLGRRLFLQCVLAARLEPESAAARSLSGSARQELEAALGLQETFEDAVQRHSAMAMLAFLNREEEGVERIAFNGIGQHGARAGTEDLYWLGALVLSGKRRDAALEKALELRPYFPEVLCLRGRLEDAVAQNPRDPWILLHRGDARRRAKNPAGAREDYEQALRVTGPDWLGRPLAVKRLR